MFIGSNIWKWEIIFKVFYIILYMKLLFWLLGEVGFDEGVVVINFLYIISLFSVYSYVVGGGK